MKCTYCGKRIWSWQSRAPDNAGYIHDEPYGCKYKKWLDGHMEKIESFIDEFFPRGKR
jgi:hypothetical protein